MTKAIGKKTRRTPAGRISHASGEDLVQALLEKPHTPAPPATPVFGVVVGRILALSATGQIDIALPSLGISSQGATAVCAPELLGVGQEIAVMFAQGDTHHPLIIGPMHRPVPAPLEVTADGAPIDARLLVEAEQEIELRCGEAAIILTRDGRILLRGTYISSHASATQRIRGGSVQIN